MQVTEPEDARRQALLYRATIGHAVRGAPALMGSLVSQTRAALRDLESRAEEARERERLTALRRQLNQCEANACLRFADELEAAFERSAAREPSMAAAAEPQSDRDGASAQPDRTAGTDAVLVEPSAQRVRHAVQIASDQALAALNAALCHLLGLPPTQLGHNPLRPAVYVDALVAALGQMPVPPAVRQGWLPLMSAALGQELDRYYRQLCADLCAQGAAAIAPEAAHPPADGSVPPAPSPLTFERLRRLLARQPARQALQTSDQYRAVTGPAPLEADDSTVGVTPTAFEATVPAAFEVAREFHQLDQVARRLQAAGDALDAQGGHPVRRQLRSQAHGLDQALALEVVALMLDNISQDPRLLAPVQDLVARLEPALLRLSLVDPQFFSHRQHPARRLLHEITHRSIAFESPDSRGFSRFMEPLHEAIAPLTQGAAAGAIPFDGVLARLLASWDAPGNRAGAQVANAVRALQQAEQRAVLAGTMVREVLRRPDAVLVPSAVLDFLCGPWAQVVAHARITDRTGADDPGQHAALIDTLMWAAQPRLASQDLPALRRLLPGLLQQLQQGLASIDYPMGQAVEFFQTLERLHHGLLDSKAFADTELLPARVQDPDGATRWSDSDNAWLAPQEASASGFIDLAAGPASVPAPLTEAAGGAFVRDAWYALVLDGRPVRVRLAWSSANGSLLLFCDALGAVHSLSRRVCERLLGSGELAPISSDPVQDALDAVARTALGDGSGAG